MPTVSVLIISHDKPRYVRQAIDSVLNQTFKVWEGWVVDSGVLLKRGFFDDIKDPRLKIVPSGESPGQGMTMLMASWCMNNWIESGAPQGELMLYLNDDDYFYPGAFETFWNYYVAHGREPQAMYASIDIGLTRWTGGTKIIGQRLAGGPAGKFCNGRKLDEEVDYLQFCHTRRLLDDFERAYGTRRCHSERKEDTKHADGIWMEQMGTLTTIHPVQGLVGCNRRTPQSVNINWFQYTLPGKILYHGRAWLLNRLRRLGLLRS